MATPDIGDDPVFVPKAERNAFERLALKFIEDERDLPFVWLSLAMTAVLIPAATFLYWPGVFRWWMAPIYWALLFGLFFDRYILMLHNTSHRRLFKRKYNLFNKYIPWVLGPFCGESPETYFTHHITMHHAEGNLPADLSSTMKYQRDNPLHFLIYFFRFFFGAIFELGAYQAKRKRWRLIRTMLFGELGFYVFCIGMMFVSWQATLVIFVIPFVLCRFLMMAGNWGQHAFVCPDEPGNPYKSSITCINARYNRRCFNDGYHIGHHVLAKRHWTDHPTDLVEQKDKYVEQDAIIFKNIDFFMVWAALMLGRKNYLADKFVDLRDEPRSREEILALFEERLKAFPSEELSAAQERGIMAV